MGVFIMKLKKIWGRLPYWCKGGIKGVLVPIIFFLVSLITPRSLETVGFTIGMVFILLNYWLGIPISHFTNCLGENCWGYWFYTSFIFSLVEFFFIGSMISWLIKKLKNE